MTRENNDALHYIMRSLREGYSFGTDRIDGYRFPFYSMVLDLQYSQASKRNVIYWRHYGQSANAANLKELRWIIETIFKTTPVEFLRTYIREDASRLLGTI